MVTAVADPVTDPVADAIAQVLAQHRPIRIRPNCPITDAYLTALTARHEGIWLETDREELIISGASADEVPDLTSDLARQVGNWGVALYDVGTRDKDGGYDPPGWEFKIPDVSWISPDRRATLPPMGGSRPTYWPIAPEFVIEVRSRNDSLPSQQQKMVGWTTHGVLLGLLVDPTTRNVHIYRNGQEQAVLHRPAQVSCEPELPGLTLDFARIWRIADA